MIVMRKISDNDTVYFSHTLEYEGIPIDSLVELISVTRYPNTDMSPDITVRYNGKIFSASLCCFKYGS